MADRTTQVAVETLQSGLPSARSTQVAVEALQAGLPKARITQAVVEVLISTSIPTPISVADTASLHTVESASYTVPPFTIRTTDTARLQTAETANMSVIYGKPVSDTAQVRTSESTSLLKNTVGSATGTIINLNDLLPVAPTDRTNIKWQADSNSPRNVSASIPQFVYPVTWGIGVGSPVTTGTGVTLNYSVPVTGNPKRLSINAKTPPVGADLIVDILCSANGTGTPTSILLAPFHLAAGEAQATTTGFTPVQLSQGDFLSLNITQVGSTTPGQDILLQLLISVP
jgi:hypothetical protein